ncbi:enoyl-CoA hydratase-related protein [Nocardia sp. NPDC056000]|uniref:enoyl-CoA hydratase-related protein n=1 Tax=Nocardia sp. NPDC056000 TaxID=3345674 RepID=UPI0035DBDCDB
MTAYSPIRWDRRADGIVLLTLDDPLRSANTMNTAFAAALSDTVDRLYREHDAVTGVVITSAKQTFFAGGDLREIRDLPSEPGAERPGLLAKTQLRRLEQLGRPVVSAIAGAALGGGLELALATHHRIVVDAVDIELGLPEVTLGLLPAGGGIVRTVRRLGVRAALEDVLLPGTRFTPRQALARGLIDQLVGATERLLPQAIRWIHANPDATQPWDRPGHRIPGDAVTAVELAALVRRYTGGAPYTAPHHITAAAAEGALFDFDTACAIEDHHAERVSTGTVAKNMIHLTFFDPREVRSLRPRLAGQPRVTSGEVAVLGDTVAAARIEKLLATQGFTVRRFAAGPVDDAVARLVIDARGGAGHAGESTDPGSVSYLTADALLTGPAKEPHRAHLRIPISAGGPAVLEIDVGRAAADIDPRMLCDLAEALGWTPIVVTGPYIARLIAQIVDEGQQMLAEGISAESITQAARVGGFTLAVVPSTPPPAQITRPPKPQVSLADLTDRLLFRVALEAIRCLDDGTVASAAEANLGSVLGAGFPRWTGGALRFADSYTGGPAGFADRARQLALDHGLRFTPPESLGAVTCAARASRDRGL